MLPSIATPANVSSGSRPGVAEHMRRRTICIAPLQHGHCETGRNFTGIGAGAGAGLAAIFHPAGQVWGGSGPRREGQCSKGFSTPMPQPSKSRTLRVTRVSAWIWAVAAISMSAWVRVWPRPCS